MTNSVCWKSLFRISVVGVVFAFAGLAHAQQSPLRQLGEAMNQEYRDIKALGPNPTPAQIKSVRNNVYRPVIKRGYVEGIQTYMKERRKGDQVLKELQAAAFPQHKKGAKGAKPGDAKPAAGGEAPAIKPSTAGADRASGTGVLEGGDGAKDVQFGGKRQQKKPEVKVIDGIIQ